MKAFCIHGHFYQPPREDPLTGKIPIEKGAAPQKNWNELIYNQCYRPNVEAGNFGQISFDIGPTLFSWMEKTYPVTTRKIVEQDRSNVEKFGVGNAMAQAYNHTILPLATKKDKITQVRWGIADFEKHFGHKPQGMWLPETAVDSETLITLADEGIQFTILSPWQADDLHVDPTMPYFVSLPQGRQITVFFFHRELSEGISFNPDWTVNADEFVKNKLRKKLFRDSEEDDPQFVLIASDGEVYGHHLPNREMFLQHLLDGASKGAGLTPMFPAQWLMKHPPRRSIGIRENTSWSCPHGVWRWKADCPCTPGARWKVYLRQAMDQLAASLDQLYLEVFRPIFRDPWEVRHQYIHVINRERPLGDLLRDLAGASLPDDLQNRLGLLLESQFERQRMFTSCGWFFGDFDRIEPRNNVRYAAQAVWLTHLGTGVDLTNQAMRDFRLVVSSTTGLRADQVFLQQMERARQTIGGAFRLREV